MGATCTHPRALGAEGLRFPLQPNPSPRATSLLVLRVPVGAAACAPSKPCGAVCVPAGTWLWHGSSPGWGGGVSRHDCPPACGSAACPSCPLPGAGHVSLLRVVLVTATQQQQQEVPLHPTVPVLELLCGRRGPRPSPHLALPPAQEELQASWGGFETLPRTEKCLLIGVLLCPGSAPCLAAAGIACSLIPPELLLPEDRISPRGRETSAHLPAQLQLFSTSVPHFIAELRLPPLLGRRAGCRRSPSWRAEKSPAADADSSGQQQAKEEEGAAEAQKQEASLEEGAQQRSEGQKQKASNGDTPTHEEQSKKERRTSEGRGLSRLFSSFLRRPKSQVSEEDKDTDATKEAGGDQKDPGLGASPDEDVLVKAPIAAPEPELKTDPSLDLHSLSSAETQPAQEERRDEQEPDSRELGGKEGGEAKEEGAKPEPKQETPETKAEKDLKAAQRAVKRHRNMYCKVVLLDDTIFECSVDKHAKGQDLLKKVCDHLNLLEEDYFGLAIWDTPTSRTWLDPAKEIKKQVHGGPWDFTFNVKFYPPDPAQLTEDITRYYLCLQLRQDIMSGRLPCSFATLALLGSYTVQSELGDYDPDLHSPDYISEFKLAPNQTKELEEKVVELHKTYRSMTPAQADLEFLENAKKLSMYGVDLHQAKDLEGVDITLGVCSSGLLVYKDKLRINRFPWPKVLKISYKRSSFFIKIRPGEQEQYESTIGFKLPSYRAAKKLWKVCVEHHTFFRLTSTEAIPKSRFLALGSKFRYSGRTQAQTRQASALIDRPAPQFERTASKRASRSLDGAVAVITPEKSPRPTSAPAIAQTHVAEPASAKSTLKDVVIASKVEKETVKHDVRREEIPLEKAKVEAADASKDLDKTQEEIKKHHASISELKKNFMESVPEPRPSEWDKRLSTHSPFRTLNVNGQIPTGADGPPLVKTQTVTISDVSSAVKSEIPTKEVPIVHTETKTITYEAAQTDGGNGDLDPGILLTAQTITSETTSSTTTTQITKTVKGGISETRIEKRIVITGDADVDHDQVLAQAIKAAKEQHPDMSVTKVVVHQETEIAEE